MSSPFHSGYLPPGASFVFNPTQSSGSSQSFYSYPFLSYPPSLEASSVPQRSLSPIAIMLMVPTLLDSPSSGGYCDAGSPYALSVWNGPVEAPVVSSGTLSSHSGGSPATQLHLPSFSTSSPQQPALAAPAQKTCHTPPFKWQPPQSRFTMRRQPSPVANPRPPPSPSALPAAATEAATRLATASPVKARRSPPHAPPSQVAEVSERTTPTAAGMRSDSPIPAVPAQPAKYRPCRMTLRLTPANIDAFCASHCLLCGATGHAYADCDAFCGSTVCLFDQRDDAVYCMTRTDWITGAVVADVVWFIQQVMHLEPTDYDVYVDGFSIAAIICGTASRDKLCMAMLTTTQLHTPCHALNIRPGSVLYVASAPTEQGWLACADEVAADSSCPIGADGNAHTTRVTCEPHEARVVPPPATATTATTARAYSPVNCTVHINFISAILSKKAVRMLLDEAGTVRRVRLSLPREDESYTKGYFRRFRYALVEYETPGQARRARVILNERVVAGYTLYVREARVPIPTDSPLDAHPEKGQMCLFGCNPRTIRAGCRRRLGPRQRERDGDDVLPCSDDESPDDDGAEGHVEPVAGDAAVQTAAAEQPQTQRDLVREAAPTTTTTTTACTHLAPHQAVRVLAYIYANNPYAEDESSLFFAIRNLIGKTLHTAPGWMHGLTVRAAARLIQTVVPPAHVPTNTLLCSLAHLSPSAPHPVLLALQLLVCEVALFVHHRGAAAGPHSAFVVSLAVAEVCALVRCWEQVLRSAADAAPDVLPAVLDTLGESRWELLQTTVPPPQQRTCVPFTLCLGECVVVPLVLPGRAAKDLPAVAAAPSPSPLRYPRLDVFNSFLVRLAQLVALLESVNDDVNATASKTGAKGRPTHKTGTDAAASHADGTLPDLAASQALVTAHARQLLCAGQGAITVADRLCKEKTAPVQISTTTTTTNGDDVLADEVIDTCWLKCCRQVRHTLERHVPLEPVRGTVGKASAARRCATALLSTLQNECTLCLFTE